jgi:predicted regulator of Ras-like GTPase activity (Roadblock/LC7/MglB family)
MESAVSREEQGQRSVAPLQRVLSATPHVRGLLVMSGMGEVRAVAGGQAEVMGKLASFAVGLMDLGARMGEESGCGELEVVMMRCAQGHMVIHHVGEDHLLFAFTDGEAPLGLLAHDLGWCAARLAEIFH